MTGIVTGIGVERMGDAADAAAARGLRLLRLENLDTDIRPPAAAIEATKRAADRDDANSYLPFLGATRLRQAVAKHVSILSGIAYDGESQVAITAGGLSGCLNALFATVEPGDEVILTDPTYIGLINRVRLARAVPRLVPFFSAGQGWRLDLDTLGRAIGPRTRAMLLMSPSMPSGGTFTRGEWERIASHCVERNLWLINDTAMERILYDGTPHIHPASFPGMAERTITVGSVSKEYRMIGWRVGWIVGPKSIMPAVFNVSLANVVTPVGIAAEAAIAALESPAQDLAAAVAEWGRRRDAILGELEDTLAVRPAGGWSMLVDASRRGLTGEEASRRLFEHGIAATPMVGWGEVNGPQFVRFVFANEPVERLIGIGATVAEALGA